MGRRVHQRTELRRPPLVRRGGRPGVRLHRMPPHACQQQSRLPGTQDGRTKLAFSKSRMATGQVCFRPVPPPEPKGDAAAEEVQGAPEEVQAAGALPRVQGHWDTHYPGACRMQRGQRRLRHHASSPTQAEKDAYPDGPVAAERVG